MKKTYFITGGTGSFGKKYISYLYKKNLAKKIIIFSRDEHKQLELKQNIPEKYHSIFRFFIGDVRDKNRLDWAIDNDVDILVHTAALKQVPATEYNPFETVLTNIIGTQNIIEVAIDKKVKKCMLISTDKAVSPVNLYGATKLTAEKLFISANIFKGKSLTKFSVSRYGNVMGSRGSVIPLFMKQNQLQKKFTITHTDMTRFNISLEYAVKFVNDRIKEMSGGEIYIPKLPSYKILNVAKAINPKLEIKKVGIRQGERLHEELINASEKNYAMEYKYYYKILPNKKMKKIENSSISYNSYNNKDFLTINELKKLIEKNLKDFEI